MTWSNAATHPARSTTRRSSPPNPDQPLTTRRNAVAVFGREVEISNVRALPDYKDPSETWAHAWDDRFLSKAIKESAPPRSGKKPRFPLIGLADLGSSLTVRRWMKFYSTHGRFMGPVLHGIRIGSSVPVESRLLSLAVGIEYFVAANRSKKKAWAADRHINRALAKYAGRHFEQWVGDVEVWADEMQSTYNTIKHDPARAVDPLRILLLVQTAEGLMSSVALSEICGRKSVVRRYLADHRLESIGRRFREEFGT